MTSIALVHHAAAHVARETIAHHSKSFALASRLLGRRVRDHTAVVYTWCRRVDDAVDDLAEPDSECLGEVVSRMGLELDGVYAGTARDPVLAALGEVVRARQIPRHYPDELLAGMAMDASDTRYARLDDLRRYAWRVAGVVGLMMSHVFGVKDDAALVHAAHLGIAMQLTNICRDVAEDWDRGRLYLPDDLLARYGAGGLAGDLGRPLPARAKAPIARVVRELLAIADLHYRSGDRGVASLPWRAAGAVMSARRVYAAIGRRIRRADHDVGAGRAVVPTTAKLGLVASALGHLVISTPARWLSPRAHVPTTHLRFEDVPGL